MKKLNEIWKNFDDNGLMLSQDAFSDLKWHIKYDENPYEAINTARDMMIETVEKDKFKFELLPTISDYLGHKDPEVRKVVLSMIVRTCKEVRYAEKALFMARFDPDKDVRDVALSGLGALINKVDSKLARKIAIHVYTVLTHQGNKKYDSVDKNAAEESLFISMGIFYPDWDSVKINVVWECFVEKYCLKKNGIRQKGTESLNDRLKFNENLKEQIHRSGMTYYNLEKVKDAQRGLLNLEKNLQNEINHLEHILRGDIKKQEVRDIKKYYKSLKRLKDNVRNQFEIIHRKVPYESKNNLI